eukprot:8644000-Lingulodinium_polyedra.AAC.1
MTRGLITIWGKLSFRHHPLGASWPPFDLLDEVAFRTSLIDLLLEQHDLEVAGITPPADQVERERRRRALDDDEFGVP